MQQATAVKKEEVEDVKLQDILIAMGHMTQTVTNALMTLQAPAQGSYQQGGQQRNQYQGNQYNNQNRALVENFNPLFLSKVASSIIHTAKAKVDK